MRNETVFVAAEFSLLTENDLQIEITVYQNTKKSSLHLFNPFNQPTGSGCIVLEDGFKLNTYSDNEEIISVVFTV